MEIANRLLNKNFRFKGWRLYTQEIHIRTAEAIYYFAKPLELPRQLQDGRFRFIKIIEGTKKPVEDDWNVTYNYKHDDPEFLDYLKKAKSYGVICRYGKLAVIDCDKKEIESDIFKKLPNTLTIKTGSGGTHFYYIIEDLKDKIVMNDDNKVHWGEVQFTDAQVLGAGSLHPNGNYYKIIQNNEIATITKEELLEVIEPYCKTKKPKFVSNSGLDLDISIVANTIHGLDRKENKLIGSQPIHGSETKQNFEIDLDKNAYYCFRCEQGGDTLCLIAVIEKLVDCSDMIPGYFKANPEIFKKTLKIARDKYGYDIKIDTTGEELLEKYAVWNDNKIMCPCLAKLILNECNLHLFICNDESTKRSEIFYYKNGYYHCDGETKIREQVNKFLGNFSTENRKNEVVGYIKDECKRFDRSELEPPVNLINCKNGILDIKTLKLKEHTPDYRFLNQIPIEWNPKAKCPKVQKFLKQVLQKDDINKILEIFGFTLYRNYAFQKAFIFYGSGSNGKGVTLRLLQKLIGKGNFSSESLTSLQKDTYSKANLYGRMANISGEMSYEALRDCSNFKQLTGQDPLSAQKKYRDSFIFNNYAKLVFNTNTIPWTGDKSFAFYRRVVIINFLETFTGKNEDANLFENELSTKNEMQGLLVESVKGLQRLLANDNFSNMMTVEETEDFYEYLVDVEKSWVFSNYKALKENDERDTNNFKVPLDYMYKEYHGFCSKEKLPCKTKSQLLRVVLSCFKNTAMWKKSDRKNDKRYITFMGLYTGG